MNPIAQIIARYPEHVVAAIMARYPHGIGVKVQPKQARSQWARGASERVTKRKETVARLHALGWSNGRIAACLNMSIDTIQGDVAALCLTANPRDLPSVDPQVAARRAKVEELWAAKKTTQGQMSRKFGVTINTIKSDIKAIRQARGQL